MTRSKWRVLIGSRSFGKTFPEHVSELEAADCEVIPNAVGRAYRADELKTALAGVHAIITGTDELTADVIRSAGQLKTIAKHGVGLETIDLDAARRRNIVVTATPHATTDAVADLAMALLLALARQIVPSHLAVAAGKWRDFTGMGLRDKVLGIVGLGRIGQGVCVRAQAFGMNVLAHDPYPNQSFAETHEVSFVSLPELLARSDAVTLHAPADHLTRPLLGAGELAQMKAGSLLINTARGALVDERALAEALRSGRLAGAGIDAFAAEPPTGSPLLALENVVLTPHIGGSTVDARRQMGEMAVANVLAALRGEKLPYQVR